MLTEKDRGWPRLVGPETVARLRRDYPDETEALTDDAVLEKYGYDRRYEAPALWDHVGEAEEDYEALADAFLELVASLKK